jgi:glycerol-3-phosphate O-acyltransferase/dihydroxyacetone phosphate acyltransferase
MSRKKAKEALAKSTVKIQAKDVIATWKVLISLGLAPILYAIYAIIVTVIAAKAGASLKWQILTPILLICSLPFVGYAALKFGEAGMDVLKSLRPLIVALVPGQQKSLNKLKTMRAELSNELADVINTFGPQYYDDFDEWRILVPSSRPPPSNGSPNLRLRHTSSAQSLEPRGDLLVHPMTWLDERLFGWSRSSRRGTSAWLGSQSGDTTRHGTPEHSDGEDAADYEHVLSALTPSGSLSPQHSRSRAGSYADLQRLRLSKPGTRQAATLRIPGSATAGSSSGASPQSASSATDSPQTIASTVDGSVPSSPESPTKTRRPRKSSLNDGVFVSRLAAVPRRESFDLATKELNREIEQRVSH